MINIGLTIFACNAKTFAIAVLAYFSFSWHCLWMELQKLLRMFHRLFPRKSATSPGKTSLHSLKNVSVTNVPLLNLRFPEWEHDTLYALNETIIMEVSGNIESRIPHPVFKGKAAVKVSRASDLKNPLISLSRPVSR